MLTDCALFKVMAPEIVELSEDNENSKAQHDDGYYLELESTD